MQSFQQPTDDAFSILKELGKFVTGKSFGVNGLCTLFTSLYAWFSERTILDRDSPDLLLTLQTVKERERPAFNTYQHFEKSIARTQFGLQHL